MKAKTALSILAILLLAGCSATHPDAKTAPAAATPAPGAETVSVTYRIIPGRELELQRVLAGAWDVYRKEHLVFAEPHVVTSDKEAGDKTRFVEVFTWVSSDAPDHAPESVRTLWGQMQACCEPRGGHEGLEIARVTLVVPSLPAP